MKEAYRYTVGLSVYVQGIYGWTDLRRSRANVLVPMGRNDRPARSWHGQVTVAHVAGRVFRLSWGLVLDSVRRYALGFAPSKSTVASFILSACGEA